MGNKIFVDSNFLIALYNPTDSLHQKALTINEGIIEDNLLLNTSNFIFLETVTVLSQRVSHAEAILRGKQIMEDGVVNLIQINKSLQDLTWTIFCEISKKNTSFVDCSTIAVMQTHGIEELLTFDQEDFEPLLKKYHLHFCG